MIIKFGSFSEFEKDIRYVRDRVFVSEQGWSVGEVYDDADPSCIQLVAYKDETPVGVARCVFDEAWHIGRVGVLKELRGLHIGVEIMRAMLGHIDASGGGEILLHSQIERQGFYEALGFSVCGEPYLQGKIEHVPMRYNIVCQNGKITIRKMNDCLEDYTLMASWLSNPVVLKYYGGRDKPSNLEKATEKYRPRICGDSYVIPCIIEYDNNAVGYTQYYRNPIVDEPLVKESLGGREYENPYGLDLFIGEPNYWSKGLGTAVVKLFVDYLLQNSIADIIFIDPQTWNKRAIRCYEKCGFKPVTVLEKRELHEGKYKDNLIMAIRSN